MAQSRVSGQRSPVPCDTMPYLLETRAISSLNHAPQGVVGLCLGLLLAPRPSPLSAVHIAALSVSSHSLRILISPAMGWDCFYR